MRNSFLNKYSSYYDLFYKDKNYEEEVDFLENVFKSFSGGKIVKILDLACGTGGHLIPLAKRGFEVSGLDASEGMLEIAQKKAEKEHVKVNIYNFLMQSFSLEEKYDAAISMFSTINYLTTYPGLKSFLKNVNFHLSKKALFVFDFWNGLAVVDHFEPYREKEVKSDEVTLRRISRTRIDEIKQLCWVDYECMVYKDGKKVSCFKENHELKFYFIDELKNYLNDAGFEVISVFPFLEINSKITKNNWDITAICQKK